MADTRYTYSYPLVLTPLRSDIEVDFKNDLEASKAIDLAVAEYNRAASASRTCPKEIIGVKKHRRQIEVTLVAADRIRSPGRALRTLSLKMLKFDCFQALLTNDRKLFTTAFEKFDDEIPKLNGITNDVLLKSVTDVIFSSEENTVMSAALQEFKNICSKYHLAEKYDPKTGGRT